MMPKHLAIAKNKKHLSGTGQLGFSLMELVVGLAVAAIALVAVVSVFSTLSRSYTTQNASASSQQVVRSGIDYMAQNIRMAGLNPAKLPGVGIETAEPNYIKFTVDRNLSGAIDREDEESMAFAYDADERQIIQGLYVPGDYIDDADNESWNSLANHVSKLAFHYFDADGNPTANIAEIRTVDILLTVEQPAGQRGTVQRTYSARVRCRNLGL